MKLTISMWRWMFLGAFAVGVMLVTAACESSDSSSNDSLPSISPSSQQIPAAATNQIVFTVTGGEPDYTWQVSDPALGSLVSANDTAIYSSLPVAGQNLVTVTDANSNAVTATITQL